MLLTVLRVNRAWLRGARKARLPNQRSYGIRPRFEVAFGIDRRVVFVCQLIPSQNSEAFSRPVVGPKL